MASILVLYHSQEKGHTAQMAEAVADGAKAAGADSILLSGFSVMKFFETIEELLTPLEKANGIRARDPTKTWPELKR